MEGTGARHASEATATESAAHSSTAKGCQRIARSANRRMSARDCIDPRRA